MKIRLRCLLTISSHFFVIFDDFQVNILGSLKRKLISGVGQVQVSLLCQFSKFFGSVNDFPCAGSYGGYDGVSSNSGSAHFTPQTLDFFCAFRAIYPFLQNGFKRLTSISQQEWVAEKEYRPELRLNF